jgi:hypothetical protein
MIRTVARIDEARHARLLAPFRLRNLPLARAA